MDRTNWHDQAGCLGEDPEIFFAEDGGAFNAGRKVCGGCDVRAFCLVENIDLTDGAVGGTTPSQRRRIWLHIAKPSPDRRTIEPERGEVRKVKQAAFDVLEGKFDSVEAADRYGVAYRGLTGVLTDFMPVGVGCAG